MTVEIDGCVWEKTLSTKKFAGHVITNSAGWVAGTSYSDIIISNCSVCVESAGAPYISSGDSVIYLNRVRNAVVRDCIFETSEFLAATIFDSILSFPSSSNPDKKRVLIENCKFLGGDRSKTTSYFGIKISG
jgi:hypothetical protein